MNEHQNETAFLQHIIRYGDSDACHKLQERIAQIHRDMRCVKRLAWAALPFPVLASVGVMYGVIMYANFPFNGAHVVFAVLCELGLASLLCLAGCLVLLAFYRLKLNRLHKHGRQLALGLLASHLGDPHSVQPLERP